MLCNRRSWARCWRQGGCCHRAGTDPLGDVPRDTECCQLSGWGMLQGARAGEEGTLQAAEQGAVSPVRAPALSWHYGRF